MLPRNSRLASTSYPGPFCWAPLGLGTKLGFYQFGVPFWIMSTSNILSHMKVYKLPKICNMMHKTEIAQFLSHFVLHTLAKRQEDKNKPISTSDWPSCTSSKMAVNASDITLSWWLWVNALSTVCWKINRILTKHVCYLDYLNPVISNKNPFFCSQSLIFFVFFYESFWS